MRRDLWLKKINELVSKNKKLVLDYTDNHFTKEGVVGTFTDRLSHQYPGSFCRVTK